MNDVKVVTRNSCRLCMPLGASLAFKGINKCVPLLHGGQGCATYIRRYMIGHFREPVDIGSSSFSEDSAVFGGRKNLFISLENIMQKYEPVAIGVATTCLSETIGEDLNGYIKEFKSLNEGRDLPYIIPVSTPSYNESHTEGYWKSVKAIVENITENKSIQNNKINVFISMLSPADIRELKRLLQLFKIDFTLLPDYSDSLDGGSWDSYCTLANGGTHIEDIKKCSNAKLSLELAGSVRDKLSPALFLDEKFDIEPRILNIPIGLEETDRFINLLQQISGEEIPDEIQLERERLLDLYIDSHKFVFGKNIALIGDEDSVISMTSLFLETGFNLSFIASTSQSGNLQNRIEELYADHEFTETLFLERGDFGVIEEEVTRISESNPFDLMISSSKGFKLSKKLDIPLFRYGFPIHDRVGSAHIKSIGYQGTLEIFEKIVNLILEDIQSKNPVGYGNY